MAEYYHENDSQLLIMNVPFNIKSNEAVNKWNADAAKHLARISQYSHVVIFVIMHSDPNKGDL
ncbi:MAG TPA: hypothetical protein VEP90_21070 [Methylomirabilota bacterium]|nr:hypothetical protein [Methylomirabilota bacterium]